ncbi:ATP-binding protein [Flavobacterium sp. J372]|uniref:ATP-binding protein n=1 Tax=Flavobacterium sp. J372 TaxID=2898436 RepID=UPI002151BDA7|nr:ATP-binding protein [Flavobacterium sp. J372]MCR5862887.1 ATP-binding protein [Flavobacterium sp. J372]
MSDQKVNDTTLPDFLSSEGELGQLIREFNWAETPLGPISSWSQSLRTTINLMLNSTNPIWIGWGPENTFLYNDAYIDVLGINKHPWALGRPASVVWEEIWDVCGPMSDKVYNEAKSTVGEDVQLFMNRGDFMEEVYYSFNYSPVFDENGKVSGLFCPNFETTPKILSVRRTRTLSELAGKALAEKTINAACSTAAATLAKNKEDIPFAVIYLLDSSGKCAIRKQITGLEQDHLYFPEKIDFSKPEKCATQTAIERVCEGSAFTVADYGNTDMLPLGMAGERITSAAAYPLVVSGRPIGAVIFGMSPNLRFDNEYSTFFEMASAQVSKALQNATAIEDERRRLEEMAELDKAKTAFFSNISHEFRTPLTLMLGTLEDLMQNYSLDVKEQQIVETTHRNALRLLKLVNTLLDFSLVESGRLKARFAPVKLSKLTENLAGNFRSVIEKAGMNFSVEVSDLGEPVFVDRQMWEKIVFNLLSNAFKYTLKGSVTLSLQKDSGNVVLKVTDTGLGIPKKELPNMFSRFHRIHSVTGRSYEGSGIGLSMIRELVLQHGGDIRVESIEGKGSTFTVTIPLGSGHLPQEQVYDAENIAEETVSGHYVTEAGTLLDIDNETKQNKNRLFKDTILIADDNADMRRHLSSILEDEYNIITVANGKEALDTAGHMNPALILSDIMMPVMDGIEMLKEIKKNPITAMIPVVLLTARAGEESRIEGYETGADDYLVKPFSAKELTARIRSQIKITKTRDHIRKQLHNVFMQSPMAVSILRGSDFVIEMANPYMLELWGKDLNKVLNKPIAEALPEAVDQGFDKLLTQVFETGESYIDEECPFYHQKDGSRKELYVKFIYKAMYDEDNNPAGIIVVAHDVTQQVISRKAVEESEAKFRHLIRKAPMGIIIVKGPDLVFEEANDRYLQYRGKTAKQIIGKPMTIAIPQLKGTAIEKNALTLLNTGKEQIHKEVAAEVEKDGKIETRYFNSIFQPLIEGDKVTGVIMIIDDVTEEVIARKLKEQNEKDLQLVLETMPHMAFRGDANGKINYYNQKYYEYTGLTFEEAKNDGWRKAIHPDMLDKMARDWQQAIKDGVEYGETFLIRRKDGMYRWHLSRVVALHDEQGNVTQWVGTMTDIHDQKIFSEKLEAMVNHRTEELHRSNTLLARKNTELEQSNRELESFNYIASHDLQEPLRKIRTFINMLGDGARNENFETYLSKIDSSAERMSQLINAVLSYSRLSGSSDNFVQTNLNEILRHVITDFELVIEEKGAIIESTDLPAIDAVPFQVNQLFCNLISNSLKYSTRKPVIKISSTVVHGYDIPEFIGKEIGQKFAEIRFTDNGIGFEEQYSRQIFKLFQRLHGRTEYSGTGIGLSICKRIVDKHNGYIRAESVLGEGSTFIILLPLKQNNR